MVHSAQSCPGAALSAKVCSLNPAVVWGGGVMKGAPSRPPIDAVSFKLGRSNIDLSFGSAEL